MMLPSRVATTGALLVALLSAVGCAEFPRRLEYGTLRSSAMRGVYMEYAVYVPPRFLPSEHLPLVVFLHGGGDGPDAFDRHGLAAQLEVAMDRGEVPRAVIVLPQGDLGFWANWYDGTRRYEDWVVDEIMPRVQRRYGTAPCPLGCHLMGVSMGAEGAVRIFMHRPGTFASVTSISGPSLDTERRLALLEDRAINILIPTHHIFGPGTPRSRVEADDPYVQWDDADALGGARFFLAWGTRDRDEIREGGAALHRVLSERGVPHESLVFEGEHAWRDWAPVIERALIVQLSPGDAPPSRTTTSD